MFNQAAIAIAAPRAFASKPGGGRASTFDAGLTLRLTPNIQPDAGANLGLTRSADDLVVFTGISIHH